jgi:hypothetical protein
VPAVVVGVVAAEGKVVVAFVIDAVTSSEPVLVAPPAFKANDAVVANDADVANDAVPCKLPVNEALIKVSEPDVVNG